MIHGGKDWGQSHDRGTPRELRRFGLRIARVEEAVKKAMADGVGLGHSSFGNGAITTYPNGVIGTIFGQQYDGTNGAVPVNGPTPPTPSMPTIVTVTGGVQIKWDGTWDPVKDSTGREIVAPTDFKGIEVHVSRSTDFTTDDFDTVVGPMITNARGGDVTVPWGDSNTPLYAKLVARATTGKKSAPSKMAGPVNSGISVDNKPPQVAGPPVLESSTQLNGSGVEIGWIKATWPLAVHNADGTFLEDLAGYMVAWRATTGAAEWQTATTTERGMTLGPLVPNLSYQVKYAAYDKTNNFSEWSTTVTLTTLTNTAPPAKPNPPVVTNYLGQLRIYWGGLLNGNLPPVDFNRIDVHVSTTSGFTPSAVTKVGNLTAAGYVFATAQYGTTMYARLVAFDNRGNASVPSDQASGTTSKVVSDDIFAGAVGSLQLADLAVTTAKIDNLAVNDAKFGSISAGKIATGILNAQVTVTGQLMTAQNNPRVTFNAAGLQGFRSNGAKWLSLTTDEALITAEIRTAESGRRVEIGAGGNVGMIEFWSSADTNRRSYVQGYTEPSGMESLKMGVDRGGHYLHNTININAAGGSTYNAISHEFQMGGAGATTGEFFVRQMTSTTGFDTPNSPIRFTVGAGGMRFRNFAGYPIIDALEAAPDQRIRIIPGGEVGTNGGIDFIRSGFADTSARMQMNQSDGGGLIVKSWQSVLQVRNRADSANNSLEALDVTATRDVHALGRVFSPFHAFVWPDNTGALVRGWSEGLEIRTRDDGGFTYVNASAFNVNSAGESKTDIADATVDAVAMLRDKIRVRKYRRIRADGTPGPEEIGLVAEEAPPELAGAEPTSDGTGTVDLYQYVTTTALALQQLIARLESSPAIRAMLRP